jgi:transposase-like protein
MANKKYDASEKLIILDEITSGEIGIKAAPKKYGQTTLAKWRRRYDKSIVSYVFGRSNNNPLVLQTFKRALQEAPGIKPMLHSDRGFNIPPSPSRCSWTKTK